MIKVGGDVIVRRRQVGSDPHTPTNGLEQRAMTS